MSQRFRLNMTPEGTCWPQILAASGHSNFIPVYAEDNCKKENRRH